ncbi:MAG: ATP-dependent DNA ligase, partial [Candidatus Eremiobacterota bacterium]
GGRLNLPLQPPIRPMLAKLSRSFPEGEGWSYEPKWDGFRTLVFYDGSEIYLQSRDLKPLGRYFPELVEGLSRVLPVGVVLDGEVVQVGPRGLDFDALQMRIHPAESRIRKLSREIPASYVAFDLLAAGGKDLSERPQRERRAALEEVLRGVGPPVFLTPSTTDLSTAEDWFRRFEGAGLDGVIAKRPGLGYLPDKREFVKIKHQRTADCVVGGFRWAKDQHGQAIGSLLLGLYDSQGVLHFVGHTSSFKAPERRELAGLLEAYRGGSSFGEGRAPGEPSRWTGGKDMSWEVLRPELVCEVVYDQLQGHRFRHAATFMRWRHDKPAGECRYEQLESVVPCELERIFGGRVES